MALFTESTATFVGQSVGTSPSSLHHGPLTGEQVALLEPMQSRVDRSLRKVERVTAAFTQFVDDGVPMLCAVRKDGQQQEIEMPFQRLSTHT